MGDLKRDTEDTKFSEFVREVENEISPVISPVKKPEEKKAFRKSEEEFEIIDTSTGKKPEKKNYMIDTDMMFFRKVLNPAAK